MRCILIMWLFFVAGCQNVIGPFAPRSPARVDDPRYLISEQESRGRDRYAIPDDTSRLPSSGGIYSPGR